MIDISRIDLSLLKVLQLLVEERGEDVRHGLAKRFPCRYGFVATNCR